MSSDKSERYVYLHIDPAQETLNFLVDLLHPDEKEQSGITVRVKMDDEGLVVDAWDGKNEIIASTWKLYSEFGVEVKEIEEEIENE